MKVRKLSERLERLGHLRASRGLSEDAYVNAVVGIIHGKKKTGSGRRGWYLGILSVLLLLTALVQFRGLRRISTPTRSPVTGIRPQAACGLLTEYSSKTLDWRRSDTNTRQYWCVGGYRTLDTNRLFGNELTYYAYGTEHEVRKLSLILNVRGWKGVTEAHGELLRSAEVLSVKAAGRDLTEHLKGAIQRGMNAADTLGNASMGVKRENWQSGSGYTIEVALE